MTRQEIVSRAYENNIIKQDTFGQLALNNFSDEIIKIALERKWIEKDFAGQLLMINA